MMNSMLTSKSGSASLQISDDKMTAWLILHKTGRLIDEAEILGLMDEAGIRFGFEEALQELVYNGFEKEYEIPIPIAVCKPSGGQYNLTLHFEPENTYRPGQAWTWEELAQWKYVPADYVLAETSVNLFTEGGSIYNVLGELADKQLDRIDLNRFAGNGVTLSPEDNSLIAQTAGYPYRGANDVIHIMDRFIYEGNLEYHDTSVSLGCSIAIKGSVRHTCLRVLGNLEVEGDIQNAEVYVDGNLAVGGNIISCRESGVVCNQDVTVKGIRNSVVLCKGILNFSTEIANSRIVAEQAVTGDSDHGIIKASQAQTSGWMDIASAGDPENQSVELEITISPFIKELLTQKTILLVKLKENPAEHAFQITEAGKELEKLEQQLSDDLNSFLTAPGSARHYIKLQRDVYPGVYIRVLKQSYKIRSYQEYAEFTE